MKCPNCNHENPDSNKFCAECGTKLKVNPSTIVCPKCYNHVPADSKFCPDCGTKVKNDSLLDSPKLWSSIEDFRNGDIIINGVIIGKTTIEDLRKMNCKIERLLPFPGCVSFDVMKDSLSFRIVSWNTEKIEQMEREHLGLLSKDFFSNEQRVVKELDLNINTEISFLKELGYYDIVGDFEKVACLLEDNGFSRSIIDGNSYTFVSNEQNSDKNFIVISTDKTGRIYDISLPRYKAWENYYTGKIIEIE